MHETTVSIFAGMFVGLIIRLAPGTVIREMLVRDSCCVTRCMGTDLSFTPDFQAYPILQSSITAYHLELGVRTQTG